MVYDLFGILELVLVIWAIMGIMQSGESNGAKLVWVIIIVLLPLAGFIAWYLIGPGPKSFPLRR